MAFFTPREIARDFLYMSFARTASLGISFVRSLIIPGLLGPFNYGIWKTLNLIQAYAQFGDLGARAALKREIPFHTGRGDPGQAARARDVAFLANNVSILIAIAATALAALLVESGPVRFAMLIAAPLLYTTHMNSFMEQYLFARKEFASMSRLNVWASLLEAILAIGLTWAMGLSGLILGTTLAYAVATWVQLGMVGFDVRMRWDRGVFRELLLVGFPSHLNGLLYNIFHSIDRWLILPFLGLAGFGQYAFGMTINDYLFQFSYTLGNIISPRLVERYSEREKVEDLRGMVEVPMTVIARIAPAALGLVYFGSEAVVRAALPGFAEGLLPLQILLIGTFFSSVPRGLSSFFITLRRQAQTVHLYVIAIALNTGLVWWMLSSGRGLPGVAAGTTLSLAFFGLGLIVLALRYFRTTPQIVSFVLSLLWPPALGAGLVAISRLASGLLVGPSDSLASTIGRSAAGAALFLAGYSPVLLVLYRQHGRRLIDGRAGQEPQGSEPPRRRY